MVVEPSYPFQRRNTSTASTWSSSGARRCASLARPGGNVTGLSADASLELWAKYLAMLKDMVPKLSRVGVLVSVGLAAHRWFDAGFGQALDVADRHVLRVPCPNDESSGCPAPDDAPKSACSTASSTKPVRIELLTRQPDRCGGRTRRSRSPRTASDLPGRTCVKFDDPHLRSERSAAMWRWT